MKIRTLCVTGFVAVLAVAALSACGGSTSTVSAAPAAAAGTAPAANSGAGPGFGGAIFQSAYLTNTYDSALPVTAQLELGTMQLEGSPNAVTADEAKQLLPLYEALKGNTLQNAAEIRAVYKQIEGSMTPGQMQAIAGMKLTRDNLSQWAQAHGVTLPSGGAGPFSQGGGPGPGQGGGGQGGGRQGGGGQGNATPDPTRVALRAELQNLAPEARATRLAQLGFRGGQGGQFRSRFNSVLLDPLLALLTKRAGS
jgi:hypothetical protein